MQRMMTTLLAALLLSGCASAFTSIERQPDGTYLITKVRSGFFSISSDVFSCTKESEDRFVCEDRN